MGVGYSSQTMKTTKDWNAAVAGELRSERGRLRLTLEQVAEASGVPKVSVERYINGKRAIPIDALAAMCEVFGLEVPEVFARAARRLDG